MMAIVNRTPDSFYDKGATFDLDPALRRSTELMVNELDRFETLLADLLEGLDRIPDGFRPD